MSEIKRTPKIRFKGFTDDWEQRKVTDIGKLSIGLVTTMTSHYTNKGTLLIRNSDIKDNHFEFGEDPIYLDEEFANKNSNRKHEIGDVITVHTGDVGTSAVIDRNTDKSIGFATIITRPNSNMIDSYYLSTFLNTEKHKKWAVSISTGDGRTNYNLGDYQKLFVPLTSVDEQRKISNFILNMDNLITLHQRKYDKLVNMKKSVLEKMFPKNSETVPEVRYKGFTDDWEQRKWNECVDISNNMVDPRTGKYDKLPHIGPGNIESFTGQFYDNIKTVGEENLISGKFHFFPGDIIYGKINPQLGKYVFPLFEGLSSADSYVLNSKNGLAQKYLFTILQTKAFYKYSTSVSMRSGMPKINRDELNSYEFNAPSFSEQEKIGMLFANIDNLITLHQRKLEKLNGLKKSMLEKMFI